MTHVKELSSSLKLLTEDDITSILEGLDQLEAIYESQDTTKYLSSLQHL